jgi:hypothetical protein
MEGMFQRQIALDKVPRLVFHPARAKLTRKLFRTNFPERNEENIFEALADEKKARMDDRWVSHTLSLVPFWAISTFFTD